ncbi:MAG: hypothetical protein HGB10_07345 [Coriobacteriia bacterium]|nr:hypothetical protein [Coriobacteriia bacterium]
MTLEAVLFYFYALVAVGGALGLVRAKRLVHAAMFFFATLVAIAGIFLLLRTEFLAAMQLFVYGGAMTVLVLFALMFTGAEPANSPPDRTWVRWLGTAVAVTFFMTAITAIWSAQWVLTPGEPLTMAATAEVLFSRLVIPFEMAGLALTIALIGTIVLAREDDVLDPDSSDEGGEAA